MVGVWGMVNQNIERELCWASPGLVNSVFLDGAQRRILSRQGSEQALKGFGWAFISD